MTSHNCLAFSSCPHLSLFHWMCSWKWFKGHVEFEGFDLYCHFAFQTFVLLSIPSTSQKLLTVLCMAWPPWAFPWLPAACSLCIHPGPLSSPLPGAGQACPVSAWSACLLAAFPVLLALGLRGHLCQHSRHQNLLFISIPAPLEICPLVIHVFTWLPHLVFYFPQ